MMLYVNGQDIGRIVLGLVEQQSWRVEPTVFEVAPEEYLATLDGFLSDHGHGRGEGIAEIAIVVGPGSATALRTSVSMINAIAFAKNIPLRPIEKAPDAPDVDVCALLFVTKHVSIAHPVYLHGARITASTKDALLRKKEV